MARLDDVQAVLDQLSAAVIEYGEETVDGVHLRLADGRLIIFTGDFIVAIHVPKKRTLQ